MISLDGYDGNIVKHSGFPQSVSFNFCEQCFLFIFHYNPVHKIGEFSSGVFLCFVVKIEEGQKPTYQKHADVVASEDDGYFFRPFNQIT